MGWARRPAGAATCSPHCKGATGRWRPPGSSFKTFAYLAAIASKRATPATLLLDSPVSIALQGEESWSPHNYDERYRGRSWDEIESDARTSYERRNPGSTWEQVKDTVRQGWDRARNKMRS